MPLAQPTLAAEVHGSQGASPKDLAPPSTDGEFATVMMIMKALALPLSQWAVSRSHPKHMPS